jgi:hypothetical protein
LEYIPDAVMVGPSEAIVKEKNAAVMGLPFRNPSVA